MVATTEKRSNAERELEEELIRRIDEGGYIVNGLEKHEPYLKLIEIFKQTRQQIDDTWHLVSDPAKLSELRVTKFAANTLIDFIPNLKGDVDRFQQELVKLQNPDEFVNKDYDAN